MSSRDLHGGRDRILTSMESREASPGDRREPVDPVLALQYAEAGMQYYILGRAGAKLRAIPVAMILLHHAVERLMKACIMLHRGREGMPSQHHIVKLWSAFRRAFPEEPSSPELDGTVRALHEFERLRYPDEVLKRGRSIVWTWYPPSDGILDAPLEHLHHFPLSFQEVDRLVYEIFRRGKLNPEALGPVGEEWKEFVLYRNEHPIIRRNDSATDLPSRSGQGTSDG